MGVYNYYDFFLDKMLAEIPDRYDKTAGGAIYDICSGCAMIAAEQADIIHANLDMLDPRNRTGSELDAYIYDHSGLERKDGVYAQVVLSVTGTCVVTPDHYFSTSSGIAFHPIARYSVVTSGEIDCECVLQGTRGNVAAGTITKVNQTVSGLVSVTNPGPASGGVTKETDEDFLDRFYEYIRKPQGTGTVEALRLAVEQIEGVGSCTVIPDRQNAIATIRITASDGGVPSSDLISRVQNEVDPKGENSSTWGRGFGIAPIGLRLNVVAPSSITLTPQIWLSDRSVVNADGVGSYFADNVYKSSEWTSMYKDGYIDYLKLYTITQDALSSFANVNGIYSDAVNIRKFAFKLGSGSSQYQDYDLSGSIPVGASPIISEV